MDVQAELRGGGVSWHAAVVFQLVRHGIDLSFQIAVTGMAVTVSDRAIGLSIRQMTAPWPRFLPNLSITANDLVACLVGVSCGHRSALDFNRIKRIARFDQKVNFKLICVAIEIKRGASSVT